MEEKNNKGVGLSTWAVSNRKSIFLKDLCQVNNYTTAYNLQSILVFVYFVFKYLTLQPKRYHCKNQISIRKSF